MALQRVKEYAGAVSLPAAGGIGSPDAPPSRVVSSGTPRADQSSADMMRAVKGFNEQMERIGELVIVLIVGTMLTFTALPANSVVFLMLLFLLIRPTSVWLVLLGAPVSRDQRFMIAWFGIRGIGSVYYLMYAINQGLPGPLAEQIATITLAAITVSIVLHGITVRPVMRLYLRRKLPHAR